MPSRYLSIYLNDHLAGSMAGVELARRARSANQDTALGAVLERVCAEIEADRRTLVQLMDRLGVQRNAVKAAAAWGEREARPAQAEWPAARLLATQSHDRAGAA